MNTNHRDVERRLTHALHTFVQDIPDYPPTSWSAVSTTSTHARQYWHRVISVAASLLLIALALALWAAPSGGLGYHGGEALRTSHATYAQLQSPLTWTGHATSKE
jgi:hypothetical protein